MLNVSEYANFFQTLQTNYKVERHSAFFRHKLLLFPQNSALIRYDIQVKTHVVRKGEELESFQGNFENLSLQYCLVINL